MNGIRPRPMGLYVPGTGFVFPQANQFVNGRLAQAPSVVFPGQHAAKQKKCRCGGRCKRRQEIVITGGPYAAQPAGLGSINFDAISKLVSSGATAIGTIIASTKGIPAGTISAQSARPATAAATSAPTPSAFAGVPLWGWIAMGGAGLAFVTSLRR